MGALSEKLIVASPPIVKGEVSWDEQMVRLTTEIKSP